MFREKSEIKAELQRSQKRCCIVQEDRKPVYYPCTVELQQLYRRYKNHMSLMYSVLY